MNPIGFTSTTGNVPNTTPATTPSTAPQTTSTPQNTSNPSTETPGMAQDENSVGSESGSSQMNLPGVSISISISINGQTMQAQSGAQGAQQQGAQPGEDPQAGAQGEQPKAGEEPKAGEQGGGAAGLEELFKKLDGDGDGKLSLEELIKALSGEQGAQPPQGAQPQPAPGGQSEPGGASPGGDQQVEELFKQMDADGDGGLSMEELAKRLQELTQGAPAAV